MKITKGFFDLNLSNLISMVKINYIRLTLKFTEDGKI